MNGFLNISVKSVVVRCALALTVTSAPVTPAFPAESSILLFGSASEYEETTISPVADSPTQKNYKIYFKSGKLSDLLRSISAQTQTNVQFTGRNDILINEFYFNGTTQRLLDRLTVVLPVGYFGNGREFFAYNLASKTIKTFRPETSNLVTVRARFTSDTQFANPPLSLQTGASNALLVEGPEALFKRIDITTPPVVAPAMNLLLIKGGVKENS